LAVKGTVAPVKGWAEGGDTVMITAGGGLEDTSPPQEIRDIASKGKTRKGNEKLGRNAAGSTAPGGW
jgi:hypothetical protein